MKASTVSDPKSGPEPQDIEFPLIDLKHCTTDEYCRALVAEGDLPFWWQHETPPDRNYAVPFQDTLGTWWYQVRPGYAWPADAVEAVPSPGRKLPYKKTYLAYQHVVPEAERSNGALVVNMILDLPAYGARSIGDKRRAVRKGLKCCEVIAVETIDDRRMPGALKCWNDLVSRTGWRTLRDEAYIRRTWERIIAMPGTTILLAIDREKDDVAGFLIIRTFGRTSYVDTIASNSDLLDSRPNDILMWTMLRNAQRIDGVTRAHYSIKSDVEALEKFKQSIGFEPVRFPAMLHARPGMMTALRLLKPATYRRLTGRS